MSSALMPAASSQAPWPWPSRAGCRHALALSLSVGLHGLALGVLLSHWQATPPAEPQVRSLTTQLISLAPPPPSLKAPKGVAPAPAPPVSEPVKPPSQVAQPQPEQAALARKRVQERQPEQQRVAEQRREQRQEQQRAAQEQAQQEARQRQQAESLARAQAAAETRAAAAALAAASRPYLPVSKEAPDYPERALDKGVEGDCTVTYSVTPEGGVENPQVLGQCHPLFVRPSLAAARTFRYQPRIVEGRAVSVAKVKNTFHYRIE